MEAKFPVQLTDVKRDGRSGWAPPRYVKKQTRHNESDHKLPLGVLPFFINSVNFQILYWEAKQCKYWGHGKENLDSSRLGLTK